MKVNYNSIAAEIKFRSCIQKNSHLVRFSINLEFKVSAVYNWGPYSSYIQYIFNLTWCNQHTLHTNEALSVDTWDKNLKSN